MALLAIVSCSSASHSGTKHVLTERGTQKYVDATAADVEYRHAERALTLAPGWSWPASPERTTGPDGEPQYYQVGAATNDAQLFWFCSWMATLAQATSPAAAAKAIQQINSVKQTQLYKSGFDPADLPWFDGVIASADQQRKPSVIQYLQENCPAQP